MSDVFILMHALNGTSLAFRFPFDVMHDEINVHQAMFPDIDITSEMFRRLQVRVCTAMLRIVEDHISMLYERDYYVLTNTGIEIESKAEYDDTSSIPVAAVDIFYDNMFQVMLVKSIEHIDDGTKLITVPVDVMPSVYENEKEEELMVYMERCIDDHFDVNMLCDAFENLTI